MKRNHAKTVGDIIKPGMALIYLNDPVRFIREVIFNTQWKGFGGKYELTDEQIEMIESIAFNKGTSVRAGRGVGKAQPHNTLIPTPTGMRLFGNLAVGDMVFGSDGKATKVVNIYEQGKRDVYEVVFDDGSKTRCCKEHLWNVKDRQARRTGGDWETLELQEIISRGVKREFKSGRKDRVWEVPTLSSAVEYTDRKITIDPYTLGAWLGDGSANKGSITNIDLDVIEKIRESREINQSKFDYMTWLIPGLHKDLKKMGISGNRSYEKSIPDDYKYNSVEVREELLRGLLDTDGTVTPNGVIKYGSTSKKLNNDVIELCRSLGYKVHSDNKVKNTFYKDKDGNKVECRDFYRCTISPFPDTKMFYIKRKQDRVRNKEYRYYGKKYIESVTLVEKNETRCIEVENEDHLYVTSDFIITHNTALLSWLILWWLCVKPKTKVIATAPSFPQLQSVLWPEVKQWLDMSLVRNAFTWTRKRLYRIDNELSWAEPRTASQEEAAQGLHNDHLLIIADEATGIEDSIMETLYGSLTEATNKMVMMFNPTRISGFAYDSHHMTKELWKVLAYSSENSSRVDKKWLAAMKLKHVHGTNINDYYRIHVLGEFPNGDPKAYFTLEEIYAARDRQAPKMGIVELGIDVASEGDDETVIVPRWGKYVITAQDLKMENSGTADGKEWSTVIAWGKTRIPDTEKRVWDVVDKVRQFTGFQDVIRIKIDAGGLGIGLVQLLEDKAKAKKVEIVRIHFGGSGKGYEDAHNEVTNMFQTLKGVIDEIQLPYDPSLIEELVTRRMEISESSGKQLVESKKSYKKEFKNSPDRADALILAFADRDNERLLVKSYQDRQTRVEVESRIIEHRGEQYLGAYISPTGILSVVMASLTNRSFGIYKTITGTTAEVLRNPALRGRFQMMVGSKTMFGDGDSVGLKMLMSGYPIIESFNYDEAGVIWTLDGMSQKKAFIVGEDCTEFKKQFSTWSVDKSQSELKETHGLCFAMAEIVSILLPQKKQAFCETSYASERSAYGRSRQRG